MIRQNHARLGAIKLFVPPALLCIAGWWGCAKGDTSQLTTAGGGGGNSTTSSSTGSSSSTSGGGSAGTGGMGGTGGNDAGPCVPTSSTPAAHLPLDIVFTVDQSSDMAGVNWSFVVNELPAFFKDPASVGLGAGLVLFPYAAYDCDLNHYKTLTVPVGVLPANAPALTSAFPAAAVGVGRPTYPALQGALMQATALKDANPTHTVLAVLATCGEPDPCNDAGIDEVAGLAASALSYDGVLTHVIALPGSTIYELNKVAAAGGTGMVHDLTTAAGGLAKALADIRTAGLGCSYAIPSPPSGPLDPSQVNLSYTPKGMGPPIVLLRAKDAAGCSGQPGWYYDDPTAPTKILLCPASCATVQADTSAEIDVLFGCSSQLE